MSIYQLGERIPQIDPSAYIHENATVIGTVILHADSSIWPGACLRGDNEPIVIGQGSNVQEGTVMHTDMGVPLTVGRNVTIGHQAMLHGCSIGDNTLIGIQAVILNHARIGANCLVGAGSLVTEGKEFPDGSLILGRPAKVVRPLSSEEISRLSESAQSYAERGRYFKAQQKKIG